MKKTKILALALAAALSFGAIGSAPIAVNASSITKMNESENLEVITPKQLPAYDSSTDGFKTYHLDIRSGQMEVIQPIKIDHKGQLLVELTGAGMPSSLNAQLYSDKACTSKVGYGSILTLDQPVDTLKAPILKKGTYYLKISSYKALTTDASIEMKPYNQSGDDKTLKNKTWAGTFNITNGKYVYHKVNITSPGYIKVEAKKNSEYSVVSGIKLYNSKKQSLTDEKSLSSYGNYSTYYAVKKGTYYIGVKQSDEYKIRYTYKAVKPSGGSSKSKAVNIKKGSTAKGLIYPGGSTNTSDWYKVTLTSKRNLSLSFKAYGNETIRFNVVPASSHVILFGANTYIMDAGATTLKTKEPLAKGTYYIQVTKNKSSASGHYQIKFN